MLHPTLDARPAVLVHGPGATAHPMRVNTQAACQASPPPASWRSLCFDPKSHFEACFTVISVLYVQSHGAGAPPLADDLAAAGLKVLGGTDCDALVRDALVRSPDVIVCWEPQPREVLFRAVETLAANAPVPVLVFTQDAAFEPMQRALKSGIHGWIVQGYSSVRLRPLVQLAQARFAHELELRESLADLNHRFEERKLVDRAKGLLMRASQISEDEAFKVLRTASMQGNRRVGQLSQQVIDMAQMAEAINRTGQLRMLAQRELKCYALAALADDAGTVAQAKALIAVSAERASANLAALERLLSRPTFGDLIDGVRAAWHALQLKLVAPYAASALSRLDASAQGVLDAADRLVVALESAGLGGMLHVVNTSGRQRMLSQRLAKEALLGQTDAARATAAEFEAAQLVLRALPISTREIAQGLDTAAATLRALLAAQRQVNTAQGRQALATSSEALLEIFEQLTERYERSMQVLIGA